MPTKPLGKLEFLGENIARCPKCSTSYEISKEYPCTSCGKIYTRQERNFYKINGSHLWDANDKYHPVCSDCFRLFFDDLSKKNRSDELAVMIICAMLDVAYYKTLFDSVVENNEGKFNLGHYLRQMGNRQYNNRPFQFSITTGALNKTEEEWKEEKESKWSKSDRTNMDAVISTIGYDPFTESELTDSDRKYCFNVLAGYCGLEGIKSDIHKLQAVIRISFLQLQCNKIEESINLGLAGNSIEEKKIKDIISSKKMLLEQINELAKHNNISSMFQGGSKGGAHTLGEKMNEMARDDFKAIKENLFDIKTSEAMLQVASLSNRSILNELTLDANDYTDIVKDQREIIQKIELELLNLEEENRLLKIKVQGLDGKQEL